MTIINNLLIVGAGASYAEAVEAGLPEENRPPLMKNFIKKLWNNSVPLFLKKEKGLVYNYLKETLQYDNFLEQGKDFYDFLVILEKSNVSNIENFFEYAWNYKKSYPKEYENLLYNGIYTPLVACLISGIFKNGLTPKLPLTEKIASLLDNGDFVLNLNYETVFEIGATNAGKTLHFLPWDKTEPSITVAKPHGSFHFFEDENGLKQARPYFVGTLSSIAGDNARNYKTFIPPRTNKNFQQHQLSRAIIKRLNFDYPRNVILWGIGFTKSDIDLYELYKKWFKSAEKISFITPRDIKPKELSNDMKIKIHHFMNVDSLLRDDGTLIKPTPTS